MLWVPLIADFDKLHLLQKTYFVNSTPGSPDWNPE